MVYIGTGDVVKARRLDGRSLMPEAGRFTSQLGLIVLDLPHSNGM